MNEQRKRPKDRASWDKRYIDGEVPWDTGDPDLHLREVVEKYRIEPGKALEIGCGTGTNAIWLARRGFEVTGLDISPIAVARAEAKASDAGVDCRLFPGDFLVDEIPGAPYQFAYDRGVLHAFDATEDRSHYASRVAELLGPEGLWHSLVGSTDGPPRDTGPPRRSAAEIARAVEPRFEILELSSTTFDPGSANQARAWILVARLRTKYPA